jgi:serine/threonine-protein kinase
MHAPQRYEITERIAKGDFATVHRGRDHELGRDVAIKQIHQQYLDDPNQLDRYWQEAQLLASLEHPHIMTIYDVVRERGWLILELAQGSLPQLLGGRGIDLKDLRLALNYTLHALKFMHEHEIIHGDVKPSNLLVDRNHRVKLGDFGIARRLVGDDGSVVKGTTKYIAPEVVSDQFGPVGPHSDLYSLGFTAYELMCGDHFETLFPGLNIYGRDQQIAWLMWHSAADRRVPDISRVLDGVPSDLAHIVQRLVEKDPAKRYRNADQVLADLSLEGETLSTAADEEEEAKAEQAVAAKRKRTLAIAAVSCSAVLSFGMLVGPMLFPSKPADASKELRATPVVSQPVDGTIVELDVERNRFFITPTDGGQPQGVTIDTELDRVFLNDQRASFGDLLRDDRVQVDFLTGGSGQFKEVYATRELAERVEGTIASVDTAVSSLLLRTSDGTELELETDDITKFSLNAKPARLVLLKPQDRVSVEHKAGDETRVAVRITALRTLSLTASLVAADDNQITVQTEPAGNATEGEQQTLSITPSGCQVSLNGQSDDDGRPLSPFDLREGDRVSIEYDVAVHRIEAFRDVTESGVVKDVNYNKREFTIELPNQGGTANFLVGAGCKIQIDSGPVDLYFLRPNDKVTVERKSPDPENREAAQISIVPKPDPRAWAIVISYQEYDSGEMPLVRFGDVDAESISRTFREHYRVPADQLLHEQNATRLRLENSVAQFLSRVAPDSQLVVYFIGHGYIDNRGIGYIVPQGFDERTADSTGLSMRWLIQELEQCPAREKVLLLDTTHEVAEPPQRYPSAVELAESVKESPRRPVSTSAIVIASCGQGQLGRKADGRGLFSVCLEDAFTGQADVNRNHRVDANELYAYLNREMPARLAASGNEQTPTLFLPDATPPRLSPEAKQEIVQLLAYLHRRVDDQLPLSYQNALNVVGDQPEPSLTFGLVMMKANRLRTAVDVLNEVRLKHPEACVAYHALAWKFFWEGNYQEGVGQLEQLTKQLPEQGDADERRYAKHLLEFAGRLTAFGELAKGQLSRSDMQPLLSAIAARGDGAKADYRKGYSKVRELVQDLDRQIKEADAIKRKPLERDRGRISYYAEMNYDEAERYVRTGLER